jgi:hypothetical protein
MKNKKPESNQLDIIILVGLFIVGYIFLIVSSHLNLNHRFSYLSAFIIIYGIWGIFRRKIIWLKPLKIHYGKAYSFMIILIGFFFFIYMWSY